MKRNVYVSGFGLCCGNGLDTQEFWKNCSSLQSGIRCHEPFKDLDVNIVSMVDDSCFTTEEKEEVRYYRAKRTVFTRKALLEALKMAQLDPSTLEEIALYLGIDFYAGPEYFLDCVINLYPQGKGEDKWEEFNLGYAIDRSFKRIMRRVKDEKQELMKSQTFFSYQSWMERYVRSLLGVPGLSRVINNLCVSSIQSVGQAYQAIANGDQEIAIAGGLEEYSFISAFTFSKLGVYVKADKPENACTPFDTNRKGLVLGEGAGLVILESEEHLKKRQKKGIARLLGYATSNNKFHITNSPSDGAGLAASMQKALNQSGKKESDIDVVVAHGTGTYVNDSSECQAINQVLPSKPLVHSMKSYIGHTLSAAGVLNVVSGLLEMQNNFVLPTLFLKNPGKNCDVNHVPAKGIQKEVCTVMTNSAGFGGFNGSIVMEKVTQ